MVDCNCHACRAGLRWLLSPVASRIRQAVCIIHPWKRFSKLDFSTTKKVPIVSHTERYDVFGKLRARCSQRRPLWHGHYSNCGDIDHG